MQRRIEPVSAAAPSSKSLQGKWGSACAVCSTAKAKCIRTDPSTSCDRCKRLSKECTEQVHQPRKKRTTKNNRTSQLEERLNGLVDLLRASGELPSEQIRLRGSRQESSSAGIASEDTASNEPSPDAAGPDHGDTIHIPSTWNAVCPPRCVCGSTPGDVSLPRVSDEDMLALYQTHLMPVFPFVVIGPETKVDHLKAKRPFLFAAIQMAATFTDIRSRRGQMYRLVQCVVDEIAIASVRSMDLLQALLVMMAWFHNHCMMHAQLNILLHLAQAQVADMGLNKEPEVQERTNVLMLAPGKPPPRNSDEKRALLGVWFLSSVLSTSLLKVSPPRFTKYLKQCLRDVKEAPESESDELLVHLIEIQRLTEHIHNWISKDEDEADIPGLPAAPTAVYQGAFEAELQKQRDSLPPHLRDDKMLRLYFASASLRLYQPPPIEASLLKSLAESLTVLRPGTQSTIDIFYRAKSALEGYFDSFLVLPVESYPVLPLSLTAGSLWSVTALARWAKVMGPGHSRTPTAPPDILTPQKVIWDPSALKHTPTAMFGRGLAPVPSFEAGRNNDGGNNSDGQTEAPSHQQSTLHNKPPSSSSRLANIPPTITDPSQIQVADIHDVADPDIARVVAGLKAQLHSQPGLNLDIIGILATLAQRFEQAHENLLKASPDGSWQNDFWYLGAKKILIARARLEKWAEIVAAGGMTGEQQKTNAASRDHSRPEQDIAMRETPTSTQTRPQPPPISHPAQTVYQSIPEALRPWDGYNTFQREIEAAGEDALPPDAVYEPDMYGSVWNDNLFDPLDPSLWLSDDNEWAATFPGSMQDIPPGL